MSLHISYNEETRIYQLINNNNNSITPLDHPIKKELQAALYLWQIDNNWAKRMYGNINTYSYY